MCEGIDIMGWVSFVFTATATPLMYAYFHSLSLTYALLVSRQRVAALVLLHRPGDRGERAAVGGEIRHQPVRLERPRGRMHVAVRVGQHRGDRKSPRLNSSH